MGWADVHAHLTHPKLADDFEGLMERAGEAGVTSIVCNGLHPDDNRAVLALAERDARIKPALGFYPVNTVLPEMRAMGLEYPGPDVAHAAEDALAWLREHVDRAVAVGEIGLDGHWVPRELWERQEEVFRALVKLAMDADKPIIIHTRKRERRAFEILQEMGARRVNWHCYTSKVKLARRIAAETEHVFSIPANARRSETFTRLLETLPRDRILFETDCPYLGPTPGVLNEPANVTHTAAYAAQLWNEPLEAVERQTRENFAHLFGFAP